MCFMATTETRIDLVDLVCPGCDCGTCVSESIREIGQIPGVNHVRVDRRRIQIVVRHDADGVSNDRLRAVVEAKGIPLATWETAE